MKISLLQISIIISLMGILLLLFLLNILPPRQLTINQITPKLLNKQVEIIATISNIKTYENSDFQVISINDSTGKIDVTLNKILSLQKNQQIVVIGKVTQYKENLQIQTEQIILTQ